jgi:hypothetical protein
LGSQCEGEIVDKSASSEGSGKRGSLLWSGVEPEFEPSNHASLVIIVSCKVGNKRENSIPSSPKGDGLLEEIS